MSATHDKGVMVDVGAYTESGEWIDGFLHMGQIKDDGGYVRQARQRNTQPVNWNASNEDLNARTRS